jgi:predicted AAA+ superfamily ATPase
VFSLLCNSSLLLFGCIASTLRGWCMFIVLYPYTFHTFVFLLVLFFLPWPFFY